MTELLTPDLCVIGAGSGGLWVAAAGAALGVPVVLIEKDKMGGECLNTGCVPSKAMIASAKRAEAIHKAHDFGVFADGVRIDFAKVHRHVHAVIAAIAPNDSVERFTGLGVRVIKGTARFKDRATVLVGGTDIKARRFVIATGSAPAVPPIPGLAETPHLTNETVFDLQACPRHLIVLGGGPIGLELSQAFRRLGAEVTVLEAALPLAKEDPECAAAVLDQLVTEGVIIRRDVKIARIGRAASGIEVVLEGGKVIAGSHLLVAAGRQADVAGLRLDLAGIRCGHGGIEADHRLMTSNRKVYAVGDVVAGAPQFTHVASYHGSLVLRHALFRLPVRVNYDSVPRVTFTDPELAHVGLTEQQVRARGGAFRVLRWPYHENDRAQAERETRGHIKVLTAKRGKILGATIVGAQAGELIATWSLAISQGLNIRAMAGLIVPYPTLAEIGKRAAGSYFTPGLTSPLLRRIIALLRRFG
jgi:pyruvate/2-oxoglutarate dehydrogenase complex dihydrolipoamide dehydrogenase (E3) component